MADKPLFIFQSLEQITVKCPFRNVIEHLDFLIHIALPDDATIALGHVAGLPANVQVMHRHKPGLHVCTRSNCYHPSEQHTRIAGAHFGDTRRRFYFGEDLRAELHE
ncbi:hypothetical protein ACSNNV_11930, partial [Faecalibacterium prausnitzii]|uniref:hypothetical protein n=1 Tax=Faecalibacterium prausnitzii TaxID=853 RepID=UPI003F1CB133